MVWVQSGGEPQRFGIGHFGAIANCRAKRPEPMRIDCHRRISSAPKTSKRPNGVYDIGYAAGEMQEGRRLRCGLGGCRSSLKTRCYLA